MSESENRPTADQNLPKTGGNLPDRPVGSVAATSPSAGLPELAPPRRTALALLLSMLVHVVALVALGLIFARTPSGTSGIADRPIGIALVQTLPDRTQYTDAAESSAESSAQQPSESESEEAASDSAATAAASAPPDFAPTVDLEGFLESVQSSVAPTRGTGMAGESNLDGDDFGGDAFEGRSGGGSSGTSDEATTMVFGISGSGSRFVYVFDRSDSMNGYGGRPLRSAKRELIRSLESLTDRQQFQLVFYNDKPTPFRLSGIPLQMIPAEDNNKIAANRYVNSILAYGATEHESALKMALRLGPDVIFFLTDARIPRLSSGQLRDIQQRCSRVGTTIHAIEFGSEPGAPRQSFLRELASMNQGQYRYVDISTPSDRNQP